MSLPSVAIPCHNCSAKKIYCEGGKPLPGNRCPNCKASNLQCTYPTLPSLGKRSSKKKGPEYVADLESRLQSMEQLLSKLMSEGNNATSPSASASQTPATPTNNDFAMGSEMSSLVQTDTSPSSRDVSAQKALSGSYVPFMIMPDISGRHITEGEDMSDDEENSFRTMMSRFRSVKQHSISHVTTPRFFGKSSNLRLIQSALESKDHAMGLGNGRQSVNHLLSNIRAEYWKPYPWEIPSYIEQPVTYNYPDEDLIPVLVDAYFTKANIFLPILHRPTFQEHLDTKLYCLDNSFGATFLVVCSIGSRFVDDPRVYSGKDGIKGPHAAGWEWYSQVDIGRTFPSNHTNIYDLQTLVLAAVFLHGFYQKYEWNLIGVGIRICQDIGLHRRRAMSSDPLESQYWSRIFWCLLCLDRFSSTGLGRSCCLYDEDIDAEPLIECDDENWIDGRPHQPPHKPSQLSFFNRLIELTRIQALTVRTIYSINASKGFMGFTGKDWEQNIVTELDSLLNRWIDSIPDHLRWDPNNQHEVFFNQSAYLYVFYYNVQILVHRPFIPRPRKPSPLKFPSLAICTNAARSCSHIVAAHVNRPGILFSYTSLPIFSAGAVLLMHVWGKQSSGAKVDISQDMQDVYKCMDALGALEKIWRNAGRFWDVLAELASASDIPPALLRLMKRRRSEYEPGSGFTSYGRVTKPRSIISTSPEGNIRSAAETMNDNTPSPSQAQDDDRYRERSGGRRSPGVMLDMTTLSKMISPESLEGSSGGSNKDSTSPITSTVVDQAQTNDGIGMYGQSHAESGPSLPMRTAQLGLPYQMSVFTSPHAGAGTQQHVGGMPTGASSNNVNMLSTMDFSHLSHVPAATMEGLPNPFPSSSATSATSVPDSGALSNGSGDTLPFMSDPGAFAGSSTTLPFSAFTLPIAEIGTGAIPSFDELSTIPSMFSSDSLNPTVHHLQQQQQQQFQDSLANAAATAPPIDFNSLWDQDMMNNIWANAPTDFQPDDWSVFINSTNVLGGSGAADHDGNSENSQS